jgi:16S rRNA (guanine527-N7)-methyltransferase
MFQELLAREFGPYGSLTSGQLEELEGHYKFLLRWNERMNLTRLTSVEDAVRLHYCESLLLGIMLPPGRLRIVDVGSGAGFPGIPIAIVRPECEVSLVECNRRKAVFLREACRKLPNTEVLPVRAEDIKRDFDWIVSRAVQPREVKELDLAPNSALLVGHEEQGGLRVPWGRNRFAMFHVEHAKI